jgi:hypothetical protein
MSESQEESGFCLDGLDGLGRRRRRDLVCGRGIGVLPPAVASEEGSDVSGATRSSFAVEMRGLTLVFHACITVVLLTWAIITLVGDYETVSKAFACFVVLCAMPVQLLTAYVLCRLPVSGSKK